jgi:glycosyltransferase involved in cell wall biosynthesis
LTVLEAMASGLPVVATDAGGNPEAVAHDRTGLLVARRDVDGLAGALRRLAGDESLRQRMGRAGQERVCQTFTRARMVAETARLYESVLG